MNIQRRQVYYSGRVQGVGFRYTATTIARQYAVTGFVQNLDDGRVQLVAEGDADEITKFLAAIAERMGSNIRRADETLDNVEGAWVQDIKCVVKNGKVAEWRVNLKVTFLLN